MSSVGSGGANSWQISVYEAAGKGNESQVRELVHEGRHFSDKYKETLKTALLKAVGRGHEPLTRLLLELGASVDDGLECDVLYRAAEAGRDKIINLLLGHGADVRAREQRFRRTALFPAAQKNHLKTLRLLLDGGADVNAKDVNNQTVLLYLASEKPEKPVRWGDDVLKLLLSAGADLEVRDKEARSALLWAAATGREQLASLLLTGRSENNANIDASNFRGKTALHLAVENKRLALVELLLEQGADIHAQSDGGWTCLLNAADKGHLEIASLLLRRGANVNATTSSGMSPLHWAARNGHLELVRLFLQQPGIRRDCKDSFDTTPMLGAAENGHIDIVKLLTPSNDADALSTSARGACEGFQATVVDFGMEKRPINHHKHSVYDLLYGWDERENKPTVTTLTRNVPAKPTFRWIHLGANNMSWIEALMSKHFVENSARDVEGFKLLERTFAQAHRGPTVHSHFMRPLCYRFDPTGSFLESQKNEAGTELPLQEVANNSTVNTTNAHAQNTKPPEQKCEARKGHKPERAPKATPMNKANPKSKGNLPGKSSSRPVRISRARERHGNIVLFMPYLHYETHENRKAMSNTIQHATSRHSRRERTYSTSGSSDQMLIHAYLHSTHNLQIRRTLDQFYYHAISTEDRDEDQVVWRYTRDKGREKKLFMVDQLWLWILSDDLIVTSFPQRWEQPKNDPLNVLNGIVEEMSSKTRPPVKSVYDLAVLITGRCIGVFDRHSIHDGDYQFLDMFESSIGEVTNKETHLFKRFNDASVAAAKVLRNSRRRRKPQFDHSSSDDDDDNNVGKDPIFVDTLLDICEETSLLAETKDIRDELNMISMVLKHQQAVLDDLSNAMFQELKDNHNQQKYAEIRRRYREQLKLIEMHLKDVDRMDRQAEGIYTSLTHLLDLKQKHANAIEARFARDQAALTGQQGQTIMVFTIVTVIFLPMSFIAAVFAIPIKDFEGTNGTPSLPFSYVAKFMFGVGLAISIPLIAVAFAVDSIRVAMRRGFEMLFRARSGRGETKDGGIGPIRRLDGEDDYADWGSRREMEWEKSVSNGEDSSPNSIRHRTERSWREQGQGRSAGAKDLERGVNGEG